MDLILEFRRCFKKAFIALLLITAVPLSAQDTDLKESALDAFQPFLGFYTFTMDSGEAEFEGTLEVRPVLDGSFIEWEFFTDGRSSWHLRIIGTLDKASQQYRLWRFDTRELLPRGVNEGTGHFSNNKFVMEWSAPANGSESWLLRNQAWMKGGDTLMIETENVRNQSRYQVITTAHRVSEKPQVPRDQGNRESPSQHVTTEELLSQPPLKPDHRIAYGTDSLNFGDLRLPDDEGPHPVGILIHGGCWLSMASLQQFDGFAEEITGLGLATWNISYRKVDEAGGGFPRTFLDVAGAVDHLRELAEEHNLDLERVYLIGHSSGGHLATWAAARAHISEESELYTPNPLMVHGLVNIAGPVDVEALIPHDEGVCGRDVIEPLMGGSPEEVPAHYENGSPANMLPLGVRQLHLVGGDDNQILPFVREFTARASEAGDVVELKVVPGAGHHDLIAPWAPKWSTVRELLQEFFGRTE